MSLTFPGFQEFYKLLTTSISIHWRNSLEPNKRLSLSFSDVVRIAPNDLSFNTPDAARDIYYHVVNGRPKLLKSDDYERKELASVAAVQDVGDHRMQRSSMSKAFSAAALVEYLRMNGDGPHGFDVIPLYTWLTRRQHKVLTEELVDERMKRGVEVAATDLFDHLRTDKQAMREEFVSQSMIFLAAGSGTVQSALTGATFYLLKKPEALSKLQKEVRGLIKKADEITDQTTSCMPYLNGVIQEALRLFPPLPSRLPRVSPGAFIYGHYVPAGTVVSATTYDMSRDPRYWSRPDEFWPERWLSIQGGEFVNDRGEASKPFSSGPRACVGFKLALLELRLVLARLVFAFDMEFVPGSEQWDEGLKVYFLWKKPPLRVRFTPVVSE
ncbi:hypothetical protein M409DRAFT_58325 [Zasmidium cellare ATCC 36951]|uniref:Cytochrome P450 n=1 Tax=Zasmidium cellare ATCC 36951 TaxID=1080233 RepID=A0A6A6C8K7_ZASCE|nr:uncharacterized protein M409DRAFT_58325 [Zasmidium cellare ATCC 36951]KAF2162588.1 hypothetical protein M409DRAFT_58325 [Zasmidium cellare ATCC 36951]